MDGKEKGGGIGQALLTHFVQIIAGVGVPSIYPANEQ
jgi:hypothetical protein